MAHVNIIHIDDEVTVGVYTLYCSALAVEGPQPCENPEERKLKVGDKVQAFMSNVGRFVFLCSLKYCCYKFCKYC